METKIEIEKLKSKYAIEPLLKKGLEVYEKYYTWQIDEDGSCAYFAAPGICFSCRFNEDSPFLNQNWRNRFCGDFQYDYRNPDHLYSFDFVRNSGTYGHQISGRNLQEVITAVEGFMRSTFVGVGESRRKDTPNESGKYDYEWVITSTAKYSVEEVAKMAFFHHMGIFPDLLKRKDLGGRIDFRATALENSPELFAEFTKIKDHYENRNKADTKYKNKLDAAFKAHFKFEITECVYQWRFELHGFVKKMGGQSLDDFSKIKEKLSPKQINILKKAFRYYSI